MHILWAKGAGRRLMDECKKLAILIRGEEILVCVAEVEEERKILCSEGAIGAETPFIERDPYADSCFGSLLLTRPFQMSAEV